jgi:hypothetical protein
MVSSFTAFLKEMRGRGEPPKQKVIVYFENRETMYSETYREEFEQQDEHARSLARKIKWRKSFSLDTSGKPSFTASLETLTARLNRASGEKD